MNDTSSSEIVFPNASQNMASIESCHHQIHILNAMVTAMTVMLSTEQRGIVIEAISAATKLYRPLLLRNAAFGDCNHQAASTIALGYETAIMQQGALRQQEDKQMTSTLGLGLTRFGGSSALCVDHAAIRMWRRSRSKLARP